METKKLYSNGSVIAAETNFESVKEGKTNLKKEYEVDHDAVVEEFYVDIDYESIINYHQLTDLITELPTYTTYTHECYFVAPKGKGKQKLLIMFPGGGLSGKSGYEYAGRTGQVFTTVGYAVLTITGYNVDFMVSKGVSSGRAVPVGSWYATRAAIKAYDYIKDKYPFLDTEGIYIHGSSQGGMMAENFVDFSGANIRATVLDAPAISMYHIQYDLRSDSIPAIYGDNDMTSDRSTFDQKKCLGCDPWTRGIIPYVGSNGQGGIEYQAKMPATSSTTVKVGKIRNTNSPVLIMGGNGDTLVSPWVVRDYAAALMNAGQWVEYICYETTSHTLLLASPMVGKIGKYKVGNGFIETLNFYKRQGGYDFEVSPLDNNNEEEEEES